MEDKKLIQVLWNYMKMNHTLKNVDCIIGLGTKDINVANVTAQLYLDGYSSRGLECL